jgi:hypothetical protein
MASGDEKPLPEAIAFATCPSSNPNGRFVITGLGSDRAPMQRRSIRSANAKLVIKTGELKIGFKWDFIFGTMPFACFGRLVFFLGNQVYELTGWHAIYADWFAAIDCRCS